MTIEQAIKILDYKTSRDELGRIELLAGLDGEKAVHDAVNEACSLACEALAAYEMAIKDNVELTTENNKLKNELERMRRERGEIENVE